MKKNVGYSIAGVGLVLLGLGAAPFDIPLLSLFGTPLGAVFAMVVVGIGVGVVLMDQDKSLGREHEHKRSERDHKKVKDLPVYEGDEIIAYRRG